MNNGVNIPCVGFGTWEVEDGQVATDSVRQAISAGYRHIDTAMNYGNEESVGKGIRESGIDRKDLFITTKLWNTDHGYESTKKAFDVSMRKLGLDYLDLYLIHWPNPAMFRTEYQQKNAESWKAMEELYRAGKIRAIGVSNFLPHHLDALLKTAEVIPAVNQIRLFPGYTMDETVQYCRERNILLEAYSPLGRNTILKREALVAIAEKHGKSPAQVCLRWCLQHDYLPLPKSVTPSRIIENTDLFDFTLSEEEMKTLHTLDITGDEWFDPDLADF